MSGFYKISSVVSSLRVAAASFYCIIGLFYFVLLVSYGIKEVYGSYVTVWTILSCIT